MTKPKVDFKKIMEEDSQLNATKNTSATDSETSVKGPAKMGRPRTKPASKQSPFHLPIELISQIDDAAAKYYGGNKSAFVIAATRAHLEHLQRQQRP